MLVRGGDFKEEVKIIVVKKLNWFRSLVAPSSLPPPNLKIHLRKDDSSSKIRVPDVSDVFCLLISFEVKIKGYTK